MTDSLNGDPGPDLGHPRPLQQHLDELIEANKAGFTDLARQGAQVDPGMLLNLRIEVLAEMAFGDGPGMLEFRLRFERKIAEVIREIRGQVRKAQLAAGAQASPEQLRQMARAQGLLGPDGKPARRLWPVSLNGNGRAARLSASPGCAARSRCWPTT
jgi:hypothetical protein